MKIGDLVKKRASRFEDAHPGFQRERLLIGIVVKVEPSRQGERPLVNFGDYGTFWQVPGMIELLS